MTNLVDLKEEGSVFIYDKSHELSGTRVNVRKISCIVHPYGWATIIRQKKGGMMLCASDTGKQFDLSIREIKAMLKREEHT